MKSKYSYILTMDIISDILMIIRNTPHKANCEDFEKSLREIYAWILDGALEVKEHKGLLEVAG
ncbi:MAG: hypothetical protein LBJ35_06080 [Spirochaetaceae bacterium]|nr:hypothetical protein [Spirochaetaceae bacterium]